MTQNGGEDEQAHAYAKVFRVYTLPRQEYKKLRSASFAMQQGKPMPRYDIVAVLIHHLDTGFPGHQEALEKLMETSRAVLRRRRR